MASAQVPGDQLGPTYTLQTRIQINNIVDRNNVTRRISNENTLKLNYNETHYEWENYDGWFNNPAHPEWGGAGKLENCKFYLWVRMCSVAANWLAFLCSDIMGTSIILSVIYRFSYGEEDPCCV